MSVVVGVLKETAAKETRVALVPEIATKLKSLGVRVLIERGAGAAAHFPDALYADAELSDASTILASADVILKVQPPSLTEVAALKKGAVIVGFMQAYARPDLVLALKSSDDRQHWLSAQALQLTVAASETRSRMSQEDLRSVPLPFIGAVVLWLTVLFVSFGLFAPRNVTVIIAVFLCAFAIAAAIKLVLDMDTPFDGLIRLARPPIHVSSDPLLHAIQVLRH